MKQRRLFTTVLLAAIVVLFSACSNFGKLMNGGTRSPIKAPTKLKTKAFYKLKLVQVEIEGEFYWFLFDTGAPMLVTPEIADKLKLKNRMSSHIKDSNNTKKKSYLSTLPEIKISGISFKNIGVFVAPMDAPIFTCYDIKGIVGANLMAKATWKVSEKEIYIADRLDLFDTSKAEKVSFTTTTQKSPYIPASLDSIVFDRVLLDYGYTGGFDLTTADYLKHPEAYDSTWLQSFGYISTGLYGSVFDTAYYQLQTLHINALEIPNVEVDRNDGNKQKIGCEVFNQYEIVLSWDENAFYFTPAPHEAIVHEDFGIAFTYMDSTFTLSSLSNYSDAIALGIEIGDEILQLNNFTIANYEEPFCEFLFKKDDLFKAEELSIVWIDNEGNEHTHILEKKVKY